MSRRLTGAALVEVLGKAADAAIAGAVSENAQRLAHVVASVDAGRYPPFPPLWRRAGEGADAEGGGLSFRASPADSGAPLPDPPPQGGRGADAPRRVTAKKAGASVTLSLSAPNLFAREYGGLDTPADPILAPAIETLRRRPA